MPNATILKSACGNVLIYLHFRNLIRSDQNEAHQV